MEGPRRCTRRREKKKKQTNKKLRHVTHSAQILTGYPTTAQTCGFMTTLTFNYSATDVPDGKQLKIVLAFDSFGSNKEIAQLGNVTAPAKTFLVAVPNPLTAEFTGAGELTNDGKSEKVVIEVIRVDKTDVTSYCGTICNDPSFALSCPAAGQNTTATAAASSTAAATSTTTAPAGTTPATTTAAPTVPTTPQPGVVATLTNGQPTDAPTAAPTTTKKAGNSTTSAAAVASLSAFAVLFAAAF